MIFVWASSWLGNGVTNNLLKRPEGGHPYCFTVTLCFALGASEAVPVPVATIAIPSSAALAKKDGACSYEGVSDTRIWAFRMASKHVEGWLQQGMLSSASTATSSNEGETTGGGGTPWLGVDSGLQ